MLYHKLKYNIDIFPLVCHCLTSSFISLLAFQSWPATVVQVNDSETNLTVCLLPFDLAEPQQIVDWDKIGEPLLY